MDLSLREKQAFFEELNLCSSHDEEADALPDYEQSLRGECKAFLSAARDTPVARKSAEGPGPVDPQPPRIPGPGPATVSCIVNAGVEIVTSTPAASHHGGPPRLATASFSDTVIPQTEQQNSKNSRPSRENHPPTRVLRSHSKSQLSPSVALAKRKRSQKTKTAPEPERLFTGLRFFYIPNNDVHPARKLRITKAQEHGAIWTKNPAEATHVIVDKELSYDDIKPVLDKNPILSSVPLVNDRYPVDCLQRRFVFDPNDTVEKYQYRVPSYILSTGHEIGPRSSTQESDKSLQIKPRRGAREEADICTQQSTQTSHDLIPSSVPEEVHVQDAASGPQRLPSPDALATCIDAVVDDPETHEYLDESDTDIQILVNKNLPKKRPKTGKVLPRQQARAQFSKDKFLCMRGGRLDRKHSGPNAETITLLEEMAEEHSLWNETWRVQSYRKAIATIRRHSTKITTAEEAAALPHIGKSLASHIEEIASTGHFKKLDELRKEPQREALRLFCNVYSVGVGTAKKWVDLGYRTLSDLRSKAKLSANQKIGVAHYDDLLTRIPRPEVKALGEYVEKTAASVDRDVQVIIGGSYRRGAEESGDIDLILTKKGTSSTQELEPSLDKLVDALTGAEFLTAALASHRHGGGNKWQGCCVLPKAAFPGPAGLYRPVWRRIDFLLVPETELGAALIYFTGNELFNRSMRLLAQKKSMKLNHRALAGVGIYEGRDEKRIFELLGVEWREPHERWC
ncbi:hypothetical protein GGS20DRAFT_585865 [Poronia punctata]|nr:hypothetical protein GGS20DRAFT_585865 [Poronia punctata]